MSKVLTRELTGAALDWAVAKCEGIDALAVPERRTNFAHVEYRSEKTGWDFREYSPSANWAQGGPIIEREELTIHRFGSYPNWESWPVLGRPSEGSTPLIAAMRCYVAFKLGDEVEIPNELLKELNG